jgi:hypothetical protein
MGNLRTKIKDIKLWTTVSSQYGKTTLMDQDVGSICLGRNRRVEAGALKGSY